MAQYTSDEGGEHPFAEESAADRVWRIDPAEPTTLIAAWPDAAAPSVTEVLAGLSDAAGAAATVAQDLGARTKEVEWACAVDIPGFDMPFVVWVEAAKPSSDDELEATGGVQPTWVVGIETVLDRLDPLRDFTGVIRLILRGLASTLAVFDVPANRWWSRSSLEHHFEVDTVDPPAATLWVVVLQGIAGEQEAEEHPDRPVRLSTAGLWRCGRPELEIVGVPAQHAETAARLLHGLAEQVFEAELPVPGHAMEIGENVRVAFYPASIVNEVPEDEAHESPPIAIVSDAPQDAHTEADPGDWPQHTILRIGDGDAPLYLSRRATRRHADFARAGFDQFATAWASVEPLCRGMDDAERPVVFLVKAGFQVRAADDETWEHLWFVVRGFDGHTIRGELVNVPSQDVGIHAGGEVPITIDQLSDWQVVTRGAAYGPGDVEPMWTAIDELRTRTTASTRGESNDV